PIWLRRALGHVPVGRRRRRGGRGAHPPGAGGAHRVVSRRSAALRQAADRLCAAAGGSGDPGRLRFARSALCAVGARRDRRELLAVHGRTAVRLAVWPALTPAHGVTPATRAASDAALRTWRTPPARALPRAPPPRGRRAAAAAGAGPRRAPHARRRPARST